MATLVGFEPTISTLKGWRAGPLHHRVTGGGTPKFTTQGSGCPGQLEVVRLRLQGPWARPNERPRPFRGVDLQEGPEDEPAPEEQKRGGGDLNEKHGSFPPSPAYEKVRSG
jgi:hypothetical protein